MDALLLLSSRAQCIKPETQSGRILGGEMPIFPVKNRQDDGRSMNGYVLGNGFYMRGFTDDDRRVMFLPLSQVGVNGRDKGTVWCKRYRALNRQDARRETRRCEPYAVPQAHYPSRGRLQTNNSSKPRRATTAPASSTRLCCSIATRPILLCELSRKPRAARWAYLPQRLIGLTPRQL